MVDLFDIFGGVAVNVVSIVGKYVWLVEERGEDLVFGWFKWRDGYVHIVWL